MYIKSEGSKASSFNTINVRKNNIKRFLNEDRISIIHKMPKVRIKLNSTDIEMINNICNSIKDIADKSGITISGPVPLPTQKLRITTRKSPCG
ncbi:MAG: 30S ribosomal protein S10, partial [Nanoarchaeota archaeon]